MADIQSGDLIAALDEASLSRCHLRAVVASGVGFFTDAYDLFVIGIASALITKDWNPSTGQLAAPGARRIGDTGGREVGQDHRGLLGTGRGKHDTDPVTQVVQVQPTRGLVLAQQRD